MIKRLLHIALLLLVGLGTAHAQQLFVGGNAEVTVANNPRITLQNAGITNQGTVRGQGFWALTGDWQNPGQYAGEEDTILLYGRDQALSGVTESQGLLVQGGGNKILADTFRVSETLQLDNGYIRPEASAVFLLEQNAESLGGSDSSFVDGVAYAQGTGFRLFPIGDSNRYRPLELLNLQGQNPIVGFEVVQPNPITEQSDELSAINNRVAWRRHQLAGSFEGSEVAITYVEEDRVENLDSLVVAGAADTSAAYRNLGQSTFNGTAAGGRVASEEAAADRYFTLANESIFTKELPYIPTALSPNAAKTADQRIKIYGGHVLREEGFSFRVYNKWGNIVFETSDLEFMEKTGWDGTNPANGEKLSIGKYRYIAKGTYTNGDTFEESEYIAIVR